MNASVPLSIMTISIYDTPHNNTHTQYNNNQRNIKNVLLSLTIQSIMLTAIKHCVVLLSVVLQRYIKCVGGMSCSV
jgi:hypothetical protein